jgi:diaminohydroxyphosphoribosylaminopyrimidine deaminase/5-amino-6-(5-phosphoribosylamino)uracil reductase
VKGAFTELDRQRMREALALAHRGIGLASPNPMVGALLVDGRGSRIAEGYHPRFGAVHAERLLLSRLADRGAVPRGAVLYLTLEPCAHQGKTPPCVDALLASPIQRFVIATPDPDPRTAGRGIRALRAAGRDVRVGLLRAEARDLNEAFFIANEEGRARVVLKIAATLDGKLADSTGRSKWITGPPSRREVARLRDACDAIVIGSGTVVADDPRLLSHSTARSSSRIVVSSRLDFDPDCRLARIWRAEGGIGTPHDRRHDEREGSLIQGNWAGRRSDRSGAVRWRRRSRLIVATARPKEALLGDFRRRGWEIWEIPDRSGRVDLRSLARRAGREGLRDLLVEPGPRLASGFLQSGPVDRILLFVAPSILGGEKGWTADLPPRPLGRILRGSLQGLPRIHGRDLMIAFTPTTGRGRMR